MVFDNIGSLAKGLGVFAVIMVVAFLVMAQAQDQVVSVQSIDESNTTQWTTAYNASRTTQEAAAGVPTWLPIIVIVAIGALLFMLLRGFGGRK